MRFNWWFISPISKPSVKFKDDRTFWNTISMFRVFIRSHQFVFSYIETINTLTPRQNGRPFVDDIFKCIFLSENERISFKISLKCVPLGPINSIPALVQMMAWRRPGDKPLSELMIVSLPTHICVTRPQWVKVLVVNIWIFGRYRVTYL